MSDIKYSIGLDFGTLSARALLVRIADGAIIAERSFDYPHAVIDRVLPETGAPLPPDFALQDPRDYLDALDAILPLLTSAVDPEDIIGLCVDFTCCTLVPVDEHNTPLCFFPEYKGEPHAYAKLWKHHAAQKHADRMTAVAAERHEKWLADYGGRISSEWLFPKLCEILECAPEVYERADGFLEAGDLITSLLVGKRTKSYTLATAKAFYDFELGYPSPEYLAAVDPRLKNAVAEKLDAPMSFGGEPAGTVCADAAKKYGLSENTVVAAPAPDAHIATAALNMKSAGDLAAIMGTSACFMLLSNEYIPLTGISGIHRDSLTPGFYGYEGGLCCFGDHFAWAADNLCTEEYIKEAKAEGISPLKLLIKKASAKKAGETGLLALNWWNGNRSVLCDSELSGLFIGMDLQTRPEDMMRALIEATAFGTRVILENYENGGVEVQRIVAAGGIPLKDPFTMQLFADVLKKEIRIAGTIQLPALSGAIYGAAAAGIPLRLAMEQMSSVSDTVYRPDPEASAVYDRLFAEYSRLYDYFGRGQNDVMKELKKIKCQAKEQ